MAGEFLTTLHESLQEIHKEIREEGSEFDFRYSLVDTCSQTLSGGLVLRGKDMSTSRTTEKTFSATTIVTRRSRSSSVRRSGPLTTST